MIARIIMLIVALGCLGLSRLSTAQPDFAQTAQAKYDLQEANKKVAREFFRPGITSEQRIALMHPDYIQHNPLFKRVSELNHVRGRDSFLLGMKTIFGDGFPTPPPGAPATDPLYMVMAEGDLVTVILKRYAPDSANAGKFYEFFSFDTWRIKEGKLYEHWDGEKMPDPAPDYLKHSLPK